MRPATNAPHGFAPHGFPIRATMASPEPVKPGTALGMLQVRRAAEPFVGADAAREMVTTIATVIVLEPGADVRQLALSSLRRLQRDDIRGDSPRVAADVDVEGCASAIARAWKGDR